MAPRPAGKYNSQANFTSEPLTDTNACRPAGSGHKMPVAKPLIRNVAPMEPSAYSPSGSGDSMESTRRTFLKHAAALSAGCLVGLEGERIALAAIIPAAAGDAAGQTAGWYDRPMRWAQLSFVEDDPGNYDLAVLARLLQEDPCRRSASERGRLRCFLSDPGSSPLSQQVAWRTWIRSETSPRCCRKLGMNVLARTDAHACHQDVYDAHPDWIMVDEKGKQAAPPLRPGLLAHLRARTVQLRIHDCCPQGDHDEVHGGRHFHQPLGRIGNVLLRALPKNFHDFLGPRSSAHASIPRIPRGSQYIVWHQKRLFELWHVWNNAIQEINPNASYPRQWRRRSAERPGHEDTSDR